MRHSNWVRVKTLWAGDIDSALFCFIPIVCSQVMTCWIWSACVFSLYFCSIWRDCTVFLTRGFSCDVFCLSVLHFMKLSLVEEPGTRTWSYWLEASFDTSHVFFDWVQRSKTSSCLLYKVHLNELKIELSCALSRSRVWLTAIFYGPLSGP